MEPRVHPALSILSTVTTEIQDEKINKQPHPTLDSRPLISSLAREGTYAFDALNIGKARIEGTFSNIAYCSFKGKPACLIVIDLDFEYHKGCLFKDAQIRLSIESESQSGGSQKKLSMTFNQSLPPRQSSNSGPAIVLETSNHSPLMFHKSLPEVM